MPHQISNTGQLIQHACPLLARIHRPGMAKSTRLMQAMDKINAELGRGTLVYAGSGLARQWTAVAKMESLHFTTGWRQVMKVGP